MPTRRAIPTTGKILCDMSWILQLFKAIDHFDVEFRKAVVPASRAEITKFAELVEQPLPQDYCDFLAFMGDFESGLFWKELVHTNLSSLVGHCSRLKASGVDFKSARCVPMAIGLDFDGFGLDLAEEQAHPPIVSLRGIRPVRLAFPSLPAMAFSHAFLYEQGATGREVKVTSVSDSKAREQVEQRLAARGYVTESFSSNRKRFLRKASALFTLVIYPTGFVDIYFGSLQIEGFDQAHSDLEASIGRFEYAWNKTATLPEVRALLREE